MEHHGHQAVRKYLLDLKKREDIGSYSKIANKIGYDKQYLSGVIHGKPPSDDFIEALKKKFPDADAAIKKLTAEISAKEAGMILETNQQPSDEIKSKTNIPHIPSDPNGKTIPIYDTEVFGGIKPNLNDAITMRPVGFISIPIFSQGDTAVQVTGHSMKGLINHMDWIIIKRITNRDNIIYGEAHMIVTKTNNIRTVKFLKKSKDPKKVKLVSYNIEQFEDQDIPWEEVLEVWRVCGLFRTV